MGKKLNVQKAIRSLYSKRVAVTTNSITGALEIDISKAQDLGNKSWGHIDFLSKFGTIIGREKFIKANSKSDKEISYERKESLVTKESLTHSYEDFANDKESAEYRHLVMLGHLGFKFNRNIFKKTKEEIKKLKSIKMNLAVPFGNQVVVNWNADSKNPTDILVKEQIPHSKRKQLHGA